MIPNIQYYLGVLRSLMVPTRATATAADSDTADIIRDMCLRSGDGFQVPDMLVVDHDPKVTSDVFRAIVKGMGSCRASLWV